MFLKSGLRFNGLRGPSGLPLALSRSMAFGAYTLFSIGRVEAHWCARPKSEREAIFDRHLQRWCRSLLALFGIELELEGRQPQPSPCARLILSNHRSPLDIAILLALFPEGYIVSRHDVADWPIVGAAARRARVLYVDRARVGSGAGVIRGMRRVLQEGGTLIVFPEGKVHAGDEVGAFHRGAFVAAQGLKVEVLPIGLAYPPGHEFLDDTFWQHIRRVAGKAKSRVALVYGAPFPATGTLETLQEAQNRVQELVRRARDLYDRGAP